MIAISATITFSARLLSHEGVRGDLLGFVGSIGTIDCAETHIADESWPASQPLRTMAGDAGHHIRGNLPLAYSALIRSSAPLGQSWPYLSRYFFCANVRNALRSGV